MGDLQATEAAAVIDLNILSCKVVEASRHA